LRIQNIGYQTLDLLYTVGLLDEGIKSLYKLKKHTKEIECLDSFGKAKTRKIINEIESKRKLKDYEFFGSLGIHTWNIKSFKLLFSKIKLTDFMNMIKLKNYDLLNAKMVVIQSIGDLKSSKLIEYLKDENNRKELYSILKEVTITESFGESDTLKGDVVFTGCRPTPEIEEIISSKGYNSSDSWSNRAKYLIIPTVGYESSKVRKAVDKGVPILTLSEINRIS
jgi:NAD-dependent DNA ligase